SRSARSTSCSRRTRPPSARTMRSRAPSGRRAAVPASAADAAAERAREHGPPDEDAMADAGRRQVYGLHAVRALVARRPESIRAAAVLAAAGGQLEALARE